MNWKFWKLGNRDPELSERGAKPFDVAKLDEFFHVLSKSGVSVNTQTALQVSAVFACCRVIAEGVAQLPFKLMRQQDRQRFPARDLRLFRLLHRQPNAWMTSFEFREALSWHALLTGNGFAYISEYAGEIRELIPLLPSQVLMKQNKNYQIEYEVNDGQRVIGKVGARNMLHLRGPMWNSVEGMDIVKVARDVIGLSIATEEYHSNLHANGGRVAGILSTTAQLNDEKIKKVREQWQKTYGGSANSMKTAVLDGAWEYKQMAMSSVDAETMAARRFQIEEVCRMFRVFPQMVMQADKASTYASAEQFFLAHVIHSLGPWIERWEQTVDRDLIDDTALYSHLETNGLLRGATKDRADYFVKMHSVGALSPNDIREMEDKNPYDGGDEYRVPMNMEQPGDEGESNENDQA